MTGGGNDVGMHRTSRGSSCVYWGGKNGTGLAPFFTHSFGYEKNVFTGERPALEYPGRFGGQVKEY